MLKFDSTAQRELIICQGEIAMKNIEVKPSLLSSNRFPAMYISGSDKIPASIMGSLTEIAFMPPKATNGINKYA
jgi:hypothetical protein